MKDYKVNKKCWCGGPESCNVCRKDRVKKRSLRKRVRQKIKQILKKEKES